MRRSATVMIMNRRSSGDHSSTVLDYSKKNSWLSPKPVTIEDHAEAERASGVTRQNKWGDRVHHVILKAVNEDKAGV